MMLGSVIKDTYTCTCTQWANTITTIASRNQPQAQLITFVHATKCLHDCVLCLGNKIIVKQPSPQPQALLLVITVVVISDWLSHICNICANGL